MIRLGSVHGVRLAEVTFRRTRYSLSEATAGHCWWMPTIYGRTGRIDLLVDSGPFNPTQPRLMAMVDVIASLRLPKILVHIQEAMPVRSKDRLVI